MAFRNATITIATSTTISDAVRISRSERVHGIETPAALTGIAMTFQGSIDNGVTYVQVMATTGAAAYSATVAPSKFVPVPVEVFAGFTHIKLVSGTAEAADRVIKVSIRKAGT